MYWFVNICDPFFHSDRLAHSINPDIPICFAALIRPIHFIILPGIIITVRSKQEIFGFKSSQWMATKCGYIFLEATSIFLLLVSLCKSQTIFFANSIHLSKFPRQNSFSWAGPSNLQLKWNLANSIHPNFWGKLWLVWPSLANCLWPSPPPHLLSLNCTRQNSNIFYHNIVEIWNCNIV